MERLELWEELQSIIPDGDIPWIIGGDFNVILNEDEKLGGLTFDQQEALDFKFLNFWTNHKNFKEVVKQH